MATRRMSHDDQSGVFQLVDLQAASSDEEEEEDHYGNVGEGFDLRPPSLKKGRCTRCLDCTTRGVTCCCPLAVRTACLAHRSLLVCFFASAAVVLVALALGFWHVWDMYADTPLEGGCLRDEATLNTFRYILRSFDEVAREVDLEYWADFGVLLGGAQRGDVLPWDRDMDISIMASSLPKLRDHRTQQAFRARGLFVCPRRLCIKPLWTARHWPEIDVNMWELDGRRVRYWRTEEEKKDPLREAVFSKYNDFDLDLLYPLSRLTIGSVSMAVPHRYEEVLRVRYPHTYGFSLPYNPRCWWSALRLARLARPRPEDIVIYEPPTVHEEWGRQKVAPPGGPPVQFLFDWNTAEFRTNPAWLEWNRAPPRVANETASHQP